MLGRLQPSMAARLATPLVPFSISALLLRPGLRWQLLEAALIALPVIGLGLLFLRGLASSLESLSPPLRGGALQLGGVVGNTAYYRHSRSPGTAAT